MRVNLLLTVSLLVTVVLAGCAGNSDPKPEPTDDLGLEATEDTGIIRGIVIDSAITPLEGVLVSLNLPGAEAATTRTRADGAFGFDGLEPGTYFVRATHAGFMATQQSVEVEAGDDSPPMTRILLERDPNALDPFAVTYVFEGFIECSTPVFGFCGFVTDVAEIGGVENATSEESQIRYALDGLPMWVQSEMVWDATNELGTRLSLLYSYGDCGGGFYCDHAVSGESPLVLAADQAKAEEIGLGNGTELYIRVFADGLQETAGLGGATLQQDVVIYTTVFYGYTPPEGWRFSEAQDEPSSG